MEKAERDYDLTKASELKYGKLPELEKKMADQEQYLAQHQDSQLLKEEVSEEDIASVVSRWTGIPVTKMMTGERENSSTSMIRSTNVSSARMKRYASSAMPSSVLVPVLKIRIVRSVRLSSSDLRGSAKQNWLRRWLKRSSMTNGISSVSI